MAEFTIEDLLIAYRKVKIDCFYETGHLTALSFAFYEQNLIGNLENLLEKINQNDLNWFSSYDFIGTHYFSLKNIDFKPNKDFEFNDDKENSFKFYSNSKRKWENSKDNNLKVDYRIIGNHSVDFHVLSSLWIEKVGRLLEEKISENSYGCRLKRVGQKDGEFIPTNLNNDISFVSKRVQGNFRPYLADYQSWQYKGLDEVKKALFENRKVLVVTADLKKYYHRIDSSFIKSYDLLKYLGLFEYTSIQKNLNDILITAIQAWSKNVYQDKNVPIDFKYKGYVGVPMGLGASKVIANILLVYLDKQIEDEIKPIYYGRYVDDIFIVLEDNGTIDSSEKFWSFMRKRIDNLRLSREESIRINKNEYIPKGYIIDIPYSFNSLIEFGRGKEKFFFLEGKSGESFLNTLKESMDENSSEWKLPPNTDSDIYSYTEQVTKASSNNSEAVNSLRKSDGISIQRLKFILYLTRFEKALDLLPKKLWDSQIEEFFLLAIDFLITPENLAVYSKYYPRIIALAIKAKKYEVAITIVNQVIYSYEKLDSILKQNEANLYNEKRTDGCLNNALKYQLNLICEGVYSTINPSQISNDKLKSFLIWIAQKVKSESNKSFNDLIYNATLLFVSDLHRIPYKESFINPDLYHLQNIKEHQLYFFDVISLNTNDLPDYNVFKKFSKWISVTFDNFKISENFMPYAFYFYTRPFSLLELTILKPDWHSDIDTFKAFTRLFNIEWFDPKIIHESENESELALKRISINAPESELNRVFAFASLETSNDSWLAVVRDDGFEPDISREQRILDLVKGILTCKKKLIHYVLFPELSIPRKLLLYLAKLFLRNKISIIAGVEYQNISSSPSSSFEGLVSNQLIYLLCVKNKDILQQISIVQEKTIPAQKEEYELFTVGGKALTANDSTKYLINHGGFFFSGLVCNDLLNIHHRASLRGEIDALIVVEWNKDVETYDSLIAASSNDLHAFVLQVNNRLYGDTRLRGPYKEHFERDKVRISGGELDYFVVATLDVDKLREFQRYHRSPDKPFKPIPTGYKMSKERRSGF